MVAIKTLPASICCDLFNGKGGYNRNRNLSCKPERLICETFYKREEVQNDKRQN